MPFATFLLAMVQPLLFQALAAIGVGLLTVTGIDLAVGQCQQWLTSSVGSLSSDMFNIFAMGGVFQGMSYIGGGISARMAFAAAGSIKRFFIR